MPLGSRPGRRAPSFSEGKPGSAEESHDPQYQLLVDEALVPTNGVARAAIITREDNTVLAGTRRFKLLKGEHAALMKYLAEPGSALQENIKIGSRTYRCVRSDHISIYAASGRTGVIIGLAKTLLVVATYSSNMQAAVCAEAVETMGAFPERRVSAAKGLVAIVPCVPQPPAFTPFPAHLSPLLTQQHI